MATSQKKTTRSAANSRSGTSSRGSASGRSGGRRRAAPKKRPVRREAGGLVCLLLALFTAVSLFQHEALLIKWLYLLQRGLTGWGWCVALPSLLLASWILLLHRGRNVASHLLCALLLPVMFGAMLHAARVDALDSSVGAIKALWQSGLELRSGGVLAGALAIGLRAVVGRIASVIVFLLGFLGCLMAALRLTPAGIVARVRSHEFLPYDEPEEPRESRSSRRRYERVSSVQGFQGTRAQSRIDVPLDDEPLAAPREPAPAQRPQKSGLFARKSDRIRTPDELLAQEAPAERPEPRIIIASPPPAEAPVIQEPPAPAAPVFRPVETVRVAEAAKPAETLRPVELSRPAETLRPVEAAGSDEPPLHTEAPPAVPLRPAEPPKPIRLDPIAPPRPAEPKPAEAARSAEAAPVRSGKLGDSEIAQAAGEVAAEIEAAEGETREYRYPPIELLTLGAGGNAEAAGAELRNNSRRLADTLKSFGVEASAGDVVRGPSVTRYEFTLEQGVKLSKITNLQDDIALALGATGVRIAPIPEKISVVGIEVPNKQVTPVHIRDVLSSDAFVNHKSSVCFSVGKDINGSPIVGDISRFPHVLIAGTTGSGKSVCTNSLIVSMLYKSTPEDVRFIMVDPKMVELAPYNGIPHLLIPVVTDPKKAAGALQWAVYEMMKRYQIFSNHGVKDLASYNKLAETDPELAHYPTVVVVIDELADLMLVAAKEVEESICRVAQMGRAAGMHLVIATQRPSSDVITGLMKANIPSRIAFAVASSLESRIILDTTGAEKLVGKGDMLYAPLGEGKPRRVQGCFISAEEIDRVVGFVKENGEASYDKDVIDRIEQNVAEKEKGGKGSSPAAEEAPADDADEMLGAAIEVVMETGQASTSMLQRRLKLGYSRAARIVDQMEERGIVGPFEGSKPRQLLITREQWEELKMKGQSAAVGAEAAASDAGEGAGEI